MLWGLLVVLWLFFPKLPFNLIYLETWFAQLSGSMLLYLAWYASGTAAQIYRYRRVSNAVQRQQTKWIVFGLVGALTGFLLYQSTLLLLPSTESGVPRLLHILIGVPIYHLFILLVPFCMGVSILRFRLWDIDFLINRSLVYLILSGIFIGIYLLSVVIFSQLLRVTIGGPQTQVATILSTLLIAVLFSPLRSRVQNGIDRRFYRKKYNAVRALAEFGITVRDEVDLDHITDQLRQVVDSTLTPSRITLWLNQPVLPDLPEETIPDQPILKTGGMSWSDIIGKDGEKD